MSWRPVTELLDRPEWYSALYSLAAHRAHDGFRSEAGQERAQREALLLALGCSSNIERRSRKLRVRALEWLWQLATHPLRGLSRLFRRRSDRRPTLWRGWPPELVDLDRDLFKQPGVIPPVQAPVVRRVPRRYAVRRRDKTEREFTRFLERTVEPSALVLLAGLSVKRSTHDSIRRPTNDSTNEKAEPWSRDELIDELATAARNRTLPNRTRLIATAVATEGLDGRAHYNLACYYAQTGDFKRAREYLRAAVFAASGARRESRVESARNDPTLAPALKGWEDPDGVLRTSSPTPPTEPLQLREIAAIGGYADKLASIGIRTPEALTAQLGSRRYRNALAKRLGVDRRLLDRWRDLMRVVQIEGIGPAELNLLEAVCVTSPEELAKADAEDLHRRCVEANTARQLVRTAPSVETLTEWQKRARRIRRWLWWSRP